MLNSIPISWLYILTAYIIIIIIIIIIQMKTFNRGKQIFNKYI